MLRITKFPNCSPCCFIPFGKVFDSSTKQLVSEPKYIIDPSIDYRSMSIEIQMENGTLGDKLDFSTFGCNKLDMSDKISNVADEINKKYEKIDSDNKELEDAKKFFESLSH